VRLKYFISFLVLLSFLLLNASGIYAVDGALVQAASTEVAVRLGANAHAQLDKLDISPAHYFDYGSYSWAILSSDQLEILEQSVMPYQVMPDAFLISLDGEEFDPAFKSLDYQDLPLGGDDPGQNLQLVQFYGPIKDAWLNTLKANALELVQYIHPYTYIVWGSSANLNLAAEAMPTRWHGAFSPAFRNQARGAYAEAATMPIQVMLYNSADPDLHVKQIQALGGVFKGLAKMDSTFSLAVFDLNQDKVEAVSSLPGVYSLQAVPEDGGLRGEVSSQINAGNYGVDNIVFKGYMAWLNGLGLSGSGVTIANVDSGVDHDHPDLIDNFSTCVGSSCAGEDQTNHGTHTAGIMAGSGASGITDSLGFLRGLGMAPQANLIEQLYDPTYKEPSGMLTLMQQSQQNGAVISGNSWGPSGTPQGYDIYARLVDIGVRDADPELAGNQSLNYVLSIMNGDGGVSSQGSPDEAKNTFTIGSTYAQTSSGIPRFDFNNLSANTAHGPALDGRTIPHLVAPGCYVDSTVINSHSTLCGTSMASPQVSGGAALFIEKYQRLFNEAPSPAMVKAAFLPVAHDLAGYKDADGNILGHPFDSQQGWGRLNLAPVLDPQVAVSYFDNPVILSESGETWQQDMLIEDPSQPVRLMLVWTDAPGHGLGGETPAWNNDLNLSIKLNGETFNGNNFDPGTGFSLPNGANDFMNNTEGIFIPPQIETRFTLKVEGMNINSDGVPGVGDETDQDFAVACYNCSVYQVSQPPVAYDQSLATDVNTPMSLTLFTSDIDAGTRTWQVGAPASGSLAGTPPNLTYTPELDWTGSDSFTFIVFDGTVPSNTATVTIEVGNGQGTPVAIDDYYEVMINNSFEVEEPGVLINDLIHNPLEHYVATLEADPPNGTVTLNQDGAFSYIPKQGFYGLDVFRYSIRHASNNQILSEATAFISVKQLYQYYFPIINK